MTPLQLDYLINGAKVFIYERPADGKHYASVHDYSQFGVKEVMLVRVKLHENSTVEAVLNAPEVIAAIETLNSDAHSQDNHIRRTSGRATDL